MISVISVDNRLTRKLDDRSGFNITTRLCVLTARILWLVVILN